MHENDAIENKMNKTNQAYCLQICTKFILMVIILGIISMTIGLVTSYYLEYNYESKPPLHSRNVTNVTGFEVGNVKLHYLQNFRNPCFLELINSENFKNGSIYDDNSFLQNANYPRKRAMTHGLIELSKTHPNGVILDHGSIMCNILNPKFECRLRCMPYFYLLGVAKSGTTDFYKRVQVHPYVHGPNTKELFWWSQYRLRLINASLSDYIDMFDKSTIRIKRERRIAINTGSVFYPSVLGEFTPVTFCDDPLWMEDPRNEGEIEPKYLKIHDLYTLNPNVKLIVILRNPVTRLYSAYNMFRKSSGSPEDFHLKIIKSMQWWSNCTNKMKFPERKCAYGSPPEMPPLVHLLQIENNRFPGKHMVSNYSSEIRKGLYVIFARDWLKVFPRGQVLFLRTEDYTNNIGYTMNEEVYPFLQLPKMDPTVMFEKLFKNPDHINRHIYKPMLYKTKLLLDLFYEPYNKQLAQFLNDDKWLWK